MEYPTFPICLAVYILISFLLAIFYLRYRRCSLLEVALWGILALFLPILGPFFVIAARPGSKNRIQRSGLAGSRAIPSPKG